jgi:ubiquinol-cytochrome c reductase cytochrome b subunit
VVGQPFFPYFLLKGQAWFFFIFGVLVLLATFAQINPVWLYGPYTPLAISAGSQPDWYLGILDGALRIMPPWELNFLGHTVTLSLLIPFLVPLGVILGGAALWPFFERWATGDKAFHNINDRPRGNGNGHGNGHDGHGNGGHAAADPASLPRPAAGSGSPKRIIPGDDSPDA